MLSQIIYMFLTVSIVCIFLSLVYKIKELCFIGGIVLVTLGVMLFGGIEINSELIKNAYTNGLGLIMILIGLFFSYIPFTEGKE